ncbi:Monooxygenase, FAD-binding [Penicillium occitanis (nom. inval.)]|nr:Monooxygenase, FAD-binding [Penicillium occitanis (nom. inval.)]PCH10476.1 hypothetical protein PENOC_001440 [Penicillium occitanis (nom. inval.)]
MEKSVAVIGAGPVGLFTALLLAQRKIHVIVIEAGEGIDQSPRAVAYFPPVLEEFAKVGIIEDVIAAGEKNADGCDWRYADGDLLAGIDPPPNDSTFAVCLSQPELGEILRGKILETGFAEIIFNEAFQRLKQVDGDVVYWTKNKLNDHETERTCRYLVGADGGHSAVRKNLDINLEGYTFESFQFVAVNFRYDLRSSGWKAANFIVDPVDWGIVVKRGRGTSWRFATGVKKSATQKLTSVDEATIQLVKDRLRRILPGDTSEIQYEAMAPYIVHQRCATRFQEGNVLLAGDAAHLTNPVGGLGLTTGLLDAAHLAIALGKVIKQEASSNLLTSYAQIRQRIFRERTSPISTSNLLRLFSQEAEHVKEREQTFAKLNDPKDIITKTRVGLSDFSLSSTSDNFFDTRGEVTWFISVTRIPGWTSERFEHEYKHVHADMTRKGNEIMPVIHQYVQLRNSKSTVQGTEHPQWDYVTCLTWPSLFIIHAGFKDPGYRENAGKHIFCRLDQEGCIMTKVHNISKHKDDKSKVDPVQCLIYHKRDNPLDEFSPMWFADRATKIEKLSASDSGPDTYILWRDVTPNTENFFHDTQFSGGSWLNYKALETFGFENEDNAHSFIEQYGGDIFGNRAETTQTVIGAPDIIIPRR